MARRKVISVEEFERMQEDLRETRFKLKAMSTMLNFTRKHLPEDIRTVIDSGTTRLLFHNRGEKPLKWTFEGEEISEA